MSGRKMRPRKDLDNGLDDCLLPAKAANTSQTGSPDPRPAGHLPPLDNASRMQGHKALGQNKIPTALACDQRSETLLHDDEENAQHPSRASHEGNGQPGYSPLPSRAQSRKIQAREPSAQEDATAMHPQAPRGRLSPHARQIYARDRFNTSAQVSAAHAQSFHDSARSFMDGHPTDPPAAIAAQTDGLDTHVYNTIAAVTPLDPPQSVATRNRQILLPAVAPSTTPTVVTQATSRGKAAVQPVYHAAQVSSITTNPSQVFRFLDLPPELRQMIYDIMLRPGVVLMSLSGRPARWVASFRETCKGWLEEATPGVQVIEGLCRIRPVKQSFVGSVRSVLSTCNFMRREAGATVFGFNVFLMQDLAAADHFVRSLDVEHRGWLHRIALRYTAGTLSFYQVVQHHYNMWDNLSCARNLRLVLYQYNTTSKINTVELICSAMPTIIKHRGSTEVSKILVLTSPLLTCVACSGNLPGQCTYIRPFESHGDADSVGMQG